MNRTIYLSAFALLSIAGTACNRLEVSNPSRPTLTELAAPAPAPAPGCSQAIPLERT
jgi:hypothetical protein